MSRTDSIRAGLAAAMLAAVMTGCADGGGDAERAANDRAKARAAWTLTLTDQGATSTMALERMDIYVSENEGESEIFEIVGDGVVLVGEIPGAMAVGYDEAFANLLGKPVMIQMSGGDPREPKSSAVTLGGVSVPVSGGHFMVNRITGKWAGSEGDKTLHGTVELRIPGADGERTVTGAFAVHAVTWG
jgi:hypothetical protein